MVRKFYKKLNKKQKGLEMTMEKQRYITEKERERCQKVSDAYQELYEQEDTIVLDAGRFGFVKLQCYNYQYGFDSAVIFTDSSELFYDLWEDWVNMKLFELVKGTPMVTMEYDEIFKCLPLKTKEKFIRKRLYFEKKARSKVHRKKVLCKKIENSIKGKK